MYILLLIVFLATHHFAAALEIDLPNHKSLYIVDGDSANIKMRLKGIDAPEIGQNCHKTRANIIDCGRLSKQHLRELLQKIKGKLQITLLEFDGYSRALVEIKKGEINIARQMVADGFAFSYYGYYKTEQNNAKAARKGFWGFFKAPQPPKLWRKKQRK